MLDAAHQLPADAAHVEVWVTPGVGLGRAVQGAVSFFCDILKAIPALASVSCKN